jgi:Flp pilus assembly protein TadB
MILVVAVSIAVWLGSSVALRRCGVSAMWLRYPLALAPAYGLFLICLGLLARRTARRLDARKDILRRYSLRRQSHSHDDDLRNVDDFLDDFNEGMRQADHGGEGSGFPAFIIVMLSATVILVCIYFIWMAPLIFAELIVEGALATWLYRPNARGASANWFSVSLEQTGLPAILMTVSLIAAGIGFQIYAPEAETVVDVFRHAAKREFASVQPNPIFGRH